MARAMQRSEARDWLAVGALARTHSERRRRLALAKCSIAALRRRLRTGDDLQAAAAVRAVFNVEDPFEQPGPTHARRRTLRVRVIACGLGCLLYRTGNDFTAQLRVGREHAMEADQM